LPNYILFIPVLPIVALALIFLIIAFYRRPTLLSGWISILAMGIAFILALAAFAFALGRPVSEGLPSVNIAQVTWYTTGTTAFPLGLAFDPLAAMMLVVVTFVSLLVQIYSQGYMAGDPGYNRYYAYLSLFTFSMLGIVLAPNFLQMYVFWELVGVSSFLLIGFWYERPAAAAAQKKAFITTRVGDLGFLIGILILFAQTKSFDFLVVQQAVAARTLAGPVLAIAMVLVFCGAIGKSAQFPLHVWLPDAMEGPTPVSALIHAATMVAAGVYLVARLFPIFQAAPQAMLVIAWIGGFTAIFAATMGLVMSDVKKVLAYSTISQLGYMMLGLGVGSLTAGTFHLFNHAFFKALLFLAAGSVIHGAGEQDMFKLGGLHKKMPITSITFLIGGLALAGVPPFSGFWSKDDIVAATSASGNTVLFLFAVITAGLTAFYIARAWLLTFTGERRVVVVAQDPGESDTTVPAEGDTGHATATHATPAGGHTTSDAVGTGHGGHGAHGGEAHESPWVMTVPLIVLAALAVVSGFWGSPIFGNGFKAFIGGRAAAEEPFNLGVSAISTIVALAGLLLAWLIYGIRIFSAVKITNAFRPIYVALWNKYGFDIAYDWLTDKAFVAFSDGLYWFDKHVIDGFVNLVAWIGYRVFGWALSRAETGVMPNYALVVFGGIVIIALILLSSPVLR
jgi:NADH-quinone oxidoreductase subunit L